MRYNRGFTLLEIVIVVLLIAILATLAALYYFQVVSKSEDTEALTNLAAIRKSELILHDRTGEFVNATDTQDVNEKLTDSEVKEKIFRYKVVNATKENFIAIAERIKDNVTKGIPIEIAMYADGDISYTYSTTTDYSGGDTGYGDSGGGYGGGYGGGGGSGGLGSGGSGGGSGSSGGGSGGSSGGGSGGSSGGGSGDIAVSTLTNLAAVGNDGFVNLGWSLTGTPPVSYDIFRTSSLSEPFEKIFDDWPYYATYYSDLNLTNDLTYYYRLELTYSTGGVFTSSVFSSTPSAASSEAIRSSQALTRLSASTNGAEITDKIDLYDVPIGFGTGVSGALAWYVPYFNTITFNMDIFGKTTDALASILAHEGTHAWWANDLTQGEPLRESPNSIDQEYHAFLNNTNVWNEIKGSEADPDLDSWASVIAMGEAQAKEVIRLAYLGLPEY